jgi:hypothetical protein
LRYMFSILQIVWVSEIDVTLAECFCIQQMVTVTTCKVVRVTVIKKNYRFLGPETYSKRSVNAQGLDVGVFRGLV